MLRPFISRFTAVALLCASAFLPSTVGAETLSGEELLPAALVGQGPTVGEDAPAFVLHAYNEDASIRLCKSPQVSLHALVGFDGDRTKKLVVLAFGAQSHEKSWQDLATLNRIHKKFKDEGVAVLMVSVDRFNIQQVYESLEREKVGFPVLRDRFKVVSRRYGVSKLPTIFLIDRDGKILSIGEGYQDNIESFLEQELRRRLQEG